MVKTSRLGNRVGTGLFGTGPIEKNYSPWGLWEICHSHTTRPRILIRAIWPNKMCSESPWLPLSPEYCSLRSPSGFDDFVEETIPCLYRYVQRGKAHYNHKELYAAMDCFSKVLEMNPGSFTAHKMLGIIQ